MLNLAWLILVFGIGIGDQAGVPTRHSADRHDRPPYMLNTVGEHWGLYLEPRWFMVDQPTHLTPDRVHGGIGP